MWFYTVQDCVEQSRFHVHRTDRNFTFHPVIIPSFHWFDSQVLTTGREFGNGACKINQEILHNQKDCRVVPKLIIIYVPNLLHLRNMNKELPGAFVNLGRPSICRVYIYISDK